MQHAAFLMSKAVGTYSYSSALRVSYVAGKEDDVNEGIRLIAPPLRSDEARPCYENQFPKKQIHSKLFLFPRACILMQVFYVCNFEVSSVPHKSV
jgi:hypothetical protein